uniref:Uncharacterized protein n=1 Tax=Eutreptiella gymnastica TaxID=73025 RepID=A0A7S4D0C5_9EUGL|mmetsp:Transcript_27952/g.47349  ORF Transcript_27952/g.47349 Transcript_27952/m.47349 type:complete len:121 (+) Transcript_27952:47-409(+)|eukprot:CAMPEP_0174285780 /NCGR_PEP_ID=MMETSP0809-20121228/9711_1 /TAXON_ID=73025 ORGANISM="Eutreptiella gymnastica-like, Strain CCMP1594" /NCGR_SAMPLE_ID=MMETSP0809 /ASSEMBLY_ACC=CAM_ASM_000658 /LENGTH=120 /DNA_ID=CAMNT_0015381639 /DNA_START=64 /DNA_END=426 /DNA_ORIENTATION=+
MSAVPANLIVNITFNPPEIQICGPIKDTTISKLQQVIPQLCTSSPGLKSGIVFTRHENPPHWEGKLPSQYCNEDMGQSQIMLAIMDALEDEADWKLKGSNGLNHDGDTKVTYKFFFVQKK